MIWILVYRRSSSPIPAIHAALSLSYHKSTYSVAIFAMLKQHIFVSRTDKEQYRFRLPSPPSLPWNRRHGTRSLPRKINEEWSESIDLRTKLPTARLDQASLHQLIAGGLEIADPIVFNCRHYRYRKRANSNCPHQWGASCRHLHWTHDRTAVERVVESRA